jgi:hypothetical protein
MSQADNLAALATNVNSSGVLQPASGGTGAATLTANNVLLGNGTSALQTVAPGTNGNLLTSNGTTWTSAAPPVGMVYPSAGIANSTGSAWGTSYSTTGSGTVVALATSPSFTTPALGTPSSGNLANCTFPTLNQNTTGNAATAGGFTPSQSIVANRIVVADAAGYIFNNYFNSVDNSVTGSVSGVMVKQGDNFLRTGSAAAIATFISGQTMNINGSSTNGTGTSSISGTGYIRFNNGLIMQWSNFTIGDTQSINVTYPVAFTTAVVGFSGRQASNNGGDAFIDGWKVISYSNSGATIRQNTNGTNLIFWQVWGY